VGNPHVDNGLKNLSIASFGSGKIVVFKKVRTFAGPNNHIPIPLMVLKKTCSGSGKRVLKVQSDWKERQKSGVKILLNRYS
jgi:hypothetical protein